MLIEFWLALDLCCYHHVWSLSLRNDPACPSNTSTSFSVQSIKRKYIPVSYLCLHLLFDDIKPIKPDSSS